MKQTLQYFNATNTFQNKLGYSLSQQSCHRQKQKFSINGATSDLVQL